MTEEERKEAIRRHMAVCLAARDHAEHGLVKIDNGWTFRQTEGDGTIRNITAQRADRFRKIIGRMDSIISAYRRWND